MSFVMKPHDSLNKNDDVGDIQRDWMKLVKQSEKLGISEGLNAGKDETFQEGFDAGYKLGYRYGLAIGRIKGALTYQEQNKGSQLYEELLSKSNTGWCQVCSNDDLINKTIEEIEALQTDICDKNLIQLQSGHS